MYPSRVSLVGALYRGLDAGLRSEKDPEKAAENEVLSLAASPGLDITGHDVYAIAMHTAKAAAVISLALRNATEGPWRPWLDPEVETIDLGGAGWRSACYDSGNGIPRRVVLVDRWSDDRKASETKGWRTIGEAVALGRPIHVTSIAIGPSQDKRRISPWTRCYRHPRNRTYRFRRVTSHEDFGATWEPVWRENTDISTKDWIAKMQRDGCMDAIATVQVPVPARRAEFAAEMRRLAGEMAKAEDCPPMRLAGCHGFGPCPFLQVCFGDKPPVPLNYNFRATALLIK